MHEGCCGGSPLYSFITHHKAMMTCDTFLNALFPCPLQERTFMKIAIAIVYFPFLTFRNETCLCISYSFLWIEESNPPPIISHTTSLWSATDENYADIQQASGCSLPCNGIHLPTLHARRYVFYSIS